MTEFLRLRVLVVEDESMVALMIEGMLEDLGCEITGSAARLDQAQRLAATADIDLALLDVNLQGQPVFPVARILKERQIPLMFSTGYGASGLPPEFAGRPVLAKPFSLAELQQCMAAALRR
jgi:CheY-like chemotaxis protein